ncbi:MAG: FlgD immunoglobulin-like domain containing protein, partial [Candidatus Eisenbacteria bacterium]
SLRTDEIDMRYNYWGEATTAEMDSGDNPKNIAKFYDRYDDSTKPMVNYSNWREHEGPVITLAMFGETDGLGSPEGDLSADLLPDGRVLVVGKKADSSTEIYDSGWRTFFPGASLGTQRTRCTATALVDGRVLVAGGLAPDGGGDWVVTLASAEVYYPDLERFLPTGDMNCPRQDFTATLLEDGTVLVVGGAVTHGGSGQEAIACCEVYDPATGAFDQVGDLNFPRTGHTATLLNDGRVLITGGVPGAGDYAGMAYASGEIYDPTRGVFALLASEMSARRYGHSALRLANGTVLVAGGQESSFSGADYSSSADIFKPATGTFSPTGPMALPRAQFGLTLLPDGNALVLGGKTASEGSIHTDGMVPCTDRVEVYNPTVRRFVEPLCHMAFPCGQFATASFSDGRLLMVGGNEPSGPTARAQLFAPGLFVDEGQISDLLGVDPELCPHVVSPNGNEALVPGTDCIISWEGPVGLEPSGYSVLFTSDGCASWSMVAGDDRGTTYKWTVPDIRSRDCRVLVIAHYSDGNDAYDMSDCSFAIGSGAGVDTPSQDQTPTKWALHDGIPNPFRDGTAIRFDLPQPGHVRISVFDVQGRLVRELIDEPRTAGSYVVAWDGKDGLGSKVSGGIYFVRLEAGSYGAGTKVIRIR